MWIKKSKTLRSFLSVVALILLKFARVTSQQLDSFGSSACNLHLGQIQCWGYDMVSNTNNRLPYFINATSFGSAFPIKVANGQDFNCAILDNGNTYCWGKADYGQLGVSSSETKDPVILNLEDETTNTVGAVENAVDIQLGTRHGCIKHSDLSLTCWGDDANKKVSGPTAYYDGSTPSKRVKLFDLSRVDTCVVSTENYMKCFGKELKHISYNATQDNNHNILAVRAGGNHGCIMNDKDGPNLMCFGKNQYGQLGNGESSNEDASNDFYYPIGLGKVKYFKIAFGHTCAVETNDSIKCWGQNENSQLGIADDSGDDVLTPTDVVAINGTDFGDASIMGIGATNQASYLILSNNKIFSWGTNWRGTLGSGRSDLNYVAKGSGNADTVQLEALTVPDGFIPRQQPSPLPSNMPSNKPTSHPSNIPSTIPSFQPSLHPFSWDLALVTPGYLKNPPIADGVQHFITNFNMSDRYYDI